MSSENEVGEFGGRMVVVNVINLIEVNNIGYMFLAVVVSFGHKVLK